jgi:hypothetical protein
MENPYLEVSVLTSPKTWMTMISYIESHGDLGIPHFKNPPHVVEMVPDVGKFM